MKEIEIKNAKIDSAKILIERGFALTAWLTLDYGGSGQSFGGYVLYKVDVESKYSTDSINYAGIFISEIMRIADVDSWDDLPGKTIRVKGDDSTIDEIGHIIKDRWFNPKKRFEAFKHDQAPK